jgi:pimeloyl-ACP methyl ester carboxylesterase
MTSLWRGLAFDLTGPPEGEPLVFLHGLAGKRSQLSELIRHLDGRYRILNLDFPGHGHSSALPATSVAELARTAAPLVEGMFEGQITLVGHSMGASAGLEMALLLQGKVRQVIALDALHQAVLYPRRGRLIAFLMGVALVSAYRPGMTRLLSSLFVAETPPEVRDRIVAAALATRPIVSARLLASLVRWDRDRALAATDVPVTVIAADAFAKAAEVAQLRPRCRIIGFPLGGHFFPTEFPKETARAVEEALRRPERLPEA